MRIKWYNVSKAPRTVMWSYWKAWGQKLYVIDKSFLSSWPHYPHIYMGGGGIEIELFYDLLVSTFLVGNFYNSIAI